MHVLGTDSRAGWLEQIEVKHEIRESVEPSLSPVSVLVFKEENSLI